MDEQLDEVDDQLDHNSVSGAEEAPDAPPDQWPAPRDPDDPSDDVCLQFAGHPRYDSIRAEPYDVGAIRARCNEDPSFEWALCTQPQLIELPEALGGAEPARGIVLVERDDPWWWRNEIRWENVRVGGNGCALAEHPPQPSCDELRQGGRGGGREGNELWGIIPDSCWGTYPTSLYELSWQSGGTLDFPNKMLGWVGSFMWTLATYTIAVVLWFVEYAVTFDMGDFTSDIARLAGDYQTNFVGPFGLMDIAWLILVGWVAITALRGRMGIAAGEVALTLVLLTLATALHQNRGDYMSSLAQGTDQMSSALLVAGQGGDPTEGVEADQAVRPLLRSVHYQFVEVPHAELTWRKLSGADECVQAANRIVSTGFYDGNWPQRYMWGVGNAIRDEHGGDNPCDSAAQFIRDATRERMLGALLTMLVAFVVAATLGVLALTLLVCKFLLALLFALTPFVLVGVVLPGAGKRVAWSGAGTATQVSVAQIGTSGALAGGSRASQTMQRATEDMSLTERWAIMLAIVVIGYVVMKKVLGGTQAMASRFADTMTRTSPGAANWAGGGSVGFDLKGIPRAMERTGLSVGRTATMGVMFNAAVGGRVAFSPFRGGGRAVLNLKRDRRQKRFSLHNLQSMEAWRIASGTVKPEKHVPFGSKAHRQRMHRFGKDGHPPPRDHAWLRRGGARLGRAWREWDRSLGPRAGGHPAPRGRPHPGGRPAPRGGWLGHALHEWDRGMGRGARASGRRIQQRWHGWNAARNTGTGRSTPRSHPSSSRWPGNYWRNRHGGGGR